MSFFSLDRVIQIKSNNSKRFDSIPLDSSVIIKPITMHNVNDGESFCNLEQINSFKDFIQQGYKGYYAYFNGKCVSRLWLFTDSKRTYINNWAVYQLKSNEAYVTWGETNKEYRGMGIFTIISKYILEENKSLTILGSVKKGNLISLKAHINLGYVIHKKITLIKVWKIKLSFIHNVEKKRFYIKLGSYI